MNNTFAIESFMDYCDEMVITNESSTSISKKYEKLQRDLEKIKEEIKQEKDIDKVIALLNKEKTLIGQVKSNISSESELGFKDTFKILKTLIIPTIFAVMTFAASKTKYPTKSEKAGVVGGMGAFTTFAAFMAKNDIDNIKDKKKIIVKYMDEMVKNIDITIKHFDYVKKQGAKTMDDVIYKEGGAGISPYVYKKPTNLKALDGLWEKFKASIKPVDRLDNPTEADINKYEDIMQKETVAFLKKYTNSSEFKTIFKKYLYMIDIKPTNYGDLFSVTFTDYQDGIDGETEDYNNDWYDNLMKVGEEFIKHRFGPWRSVVWNDVDTGDGDEGTIYVS